MAQRLDHAQLTLPSLLQVPATSPQSNSSHIPSVEHNQLGIVVFAQPRQKRSVRSQNAIVAAILDACRTPTVQHWVMIKARLGYDTFWHHMNNLLSRGMMDELNEGSRTLYRVNAKGLELLSQLSGV